jgi:glycosyltransferase involved in cell wall biosynthesis
MNKARILHILQCTNLGGMEQNTLELIRSFRELGCDNSLVSLNPIGRLGPMLEDQGARVAGIQYRRPAGVPSIPSMFSEFRRHEAIDGVVMSGPNMAAFAALVGLKCKRRILFVHYHHVGVKPRWQWQIIYASATRIFEKIAFCSDFIRTEAEEIYPPLRDVSITSRNLYRLPPVPQERDRQTARKALCIPENSLVVGNAGWLIPRKRWDVFLHTAAKISKQFRNVIFLACGDGPLRKDLIEQSSALGIADRIRWLGWQNDLTSFYLSLDLLLFNSDWDALGRTPLEAGAYQVPTVASVLNGGLKEVITSDQVGYLLGRHDVDWLAESAIRLLKDAGLRGSIGTVCRQVLAERYDPTCNAMKVLDLLGVQATFKHEPSRQV